MKQAKNMKRLKTILATGIVGIVVVIILFPFYLMIMMSTYTSQQLYTGIHLLPGPYLLENLRAVFAGTRFLTFYLNSAIIAVSATFLGVSSSAMAGFAFAKYEFRFKNGLFIFILMTMMIPGNLGMIAFIIQMSRFGWMNTFYPLIVPAMANSFGVFWMTQYMKSSLPTEIIESARIDGASDWRTFVQIVIPMVKAAIITLSLLAFLGSWNSYMMPMLIINRMDNFTVPLGLMTLNDTYVQNIGAMITALAVGTLPMVIIFAFGSKYFIRGLVAGALKG